MKTISQIISFIFHPLLVLTYGLVLFLLVNPFLFGYHRLGEGMILLVVVWSSSFLIPGFAVFLMRMLGLISDLQMVDPHDRIGPAIVTGVFYLWMFMNFKDNPDIPPAYAAFVLGAIISLFVAFAINFAFEVSWHTTGIAGLVFLIVMLRNHYSDGNISIEMGNESILFISMDLMLILGLAIAGLVGTARLMIGAHKPSELYVGYFIGAVCQLIAFQMML